MRPLIVLGATGSIGRQTLDVARRLGLVVAGVGARRGSTKLLAIAAEFPDAVTAVAAPTPQERRTFQRELGRRASFGPDAMESIAATPGHIVINGVVGAAGFGPSMAAIRAGNRLALANKESLVAGGDVLSVEAAANDAEIVPVDSEHSALWQCLVGESREVSRLILTASGGPFRGRSRDSLAEVSVAEALAHPTWAMGSRITVDSSTLMNKAFEVIEAHHLFDVPYDDIDVVVHPQSIVHSMVEFVDGSVKAQLGDPDMRLPIQYAITYPDRVPFPGKQFDITKQGLTFEDPDLATFRMLAMGYAAGRQGGSSPAVLNAADEVAVAAFLEDRIRYLDIEAVVEHSLETVEWRELADVADVLEADAAGRRAASARVDVLASA